MKVKLLKKFRKRFKFTKVNGYTQMWDRETDMIYSPECCSVHTNRSIREQLEAKAILLLTGASRWREMDCKKYKRRQIFLENKVKNDCIKNDNPN